MRNKKKLKHVTAEKGEGNRGRGLREIMLIVWHHDMKEHLYYKSLTVYENEVR